MISAVFAATTTAVTVSDASQDCCGKANVDSAKLFFAEEEDEKRGSTSMEVIRTARGWIIFEENQLCADVQPIPINIG